MKVILVLFMKKIIKFVFFEKDCFKVLRFRICLNNFIMVVMFYLVSKINLFIFNLYKIICLCFNTACEKNILIYLMLIFKFCINFKNFNLFLK